MGHRSGSPGDRLDRFGVRFVDAIHPFDSMMRFVDSIRRFDSLLRLQPIDSTSRPGGMREAIKYGDFMYRS